MAVTGLSSVKPAMTKDSEIKSGCTTPAAPIQRHVKVKGEANAYDRAYETYFEDREGAHMLDTFRVLARFAISGMNKPDSALCAQQNHSDHRMAASLLSAREMGGSRSADNRVLLHPECHDRVHQASVFYLETASARTRRSKCLSRMTGNCDVRVWRGLGVRKVARLLGNLLLTIAEIPPERPSALKLALQRVETMCFRHATLFRCKCGKHMT